MKKELKDKLETMSHSDLMRWLSWIVAFASGLLLAIYGIYFLHFSKSGISNDPAAWGQFGDFTGGTINPILGFLTLIALVLTIILQSRQLSISSRELELSRKELELTRNELTRSAEAQELSEKALRAQATAADRSARLNAINFLLAHYQTQLKKYQGNAYLANDPRLEAMHALEEKSATLNSMLEDVFHEITEGERNG